jgi:UDP-N-acetyl-D-mannosaminuronate dehydrogenase
MNSVSVFGGGHVGLPVAAAAVDAGFDTSYIDISSERVREIWVGSVRWDEPTINETGTAKPS